MPGIENEIPLVENEEKFICFLMKNVFVRRCI